MPYCRYPASARSIAGQHPGLRIGGRHRDPKYTATSSTLAKRKGSIARG
jgi:hypothetical protein